MTFYKWSQTAAADATADSTINWAEGQAPSSVNDSTRAMMAATAKFRDDIAGAIVTGGTSTAYTVSSYQAFDSLAHLGGQMIAFTPHATNGAIVTLNVDSLGAKPLRTSPNVELQSGVLIQGTPYLVLYNNGDGAFYLFGNAGAPTIPLAAGMDYWGAITPSSAFAFPAGQAISRTTYANLFALIGTTYGAGDGTTTFNLPDKRGRVSAALDPSGTVLTGATITTGGANSLGGAGGEQQHILQTTEIPAHSHGVNDLGHSHGVNTPNLWLQDNGSGSQHQGTVGGSDYNNITISSATTGITIQNAGGGGAHNNVQPTIMCNYIMRVL